MHPNLALLRVNLIALLRNWIRANWSMIFNSGSLVATRLIAAVSGFAFWAIAANRFPTEAIGFAGGGLIGLVAVSAIDAVSDNSKNEWRYPLARVVLEPIPQRTAAR